MIIYMPEKYCAVGGITICGEESWHSLECKGTQPEEVKSTHRFISRELRFCVWHLHFVFVSASPWNKQ